MDDLFAANKRVALAVDDPELRRGSELIDLSGRQTNLIAILVRDVLLAEVGGTAPDGLNTPQEISAVAASLSELRSNEELIDTKATGQYRADGRRPVRRPRDRRLPAGGRRGDSPRATPTSRRW